MTELATHVGVFDFSLGKLLLVLVDLSALGISRSF